MVMEIIAFSYFEVSIRLIIWKSLYQLRHAFIVFMGTHVTSTCITATRRLYYTGSYYFTCLCYYYTDTLVQRTLLFMCLYHCYTDTLVYWTLLCRIDTCYNGYLLHQILLSLLHGFHLYSCPKCSCIPVARLTVPVTWISVIWIFMFDT